MKCKPFAIVQWWDNTNWLNRSKHDCTIRSKFWLRLRPNMCVTKMSERNVHEVKKNNYYGKKLRTKGETAILFELKLFFSQKIRIFYYWIDREFDNKTDFHTFQTNCLSFHSYKSNISMWYCSNESVYH